MLLSWLFTYEFNWKHNEVAFFSQNHFDTWCFIFITTNKVRDLRRTLVLKIKMENMKAEAFVIQR